MLTIRVPLRFQLVRELGRGGMGTVYEAIDKERGGRVAVKTLQSNDPVAIARFKREFRALQDIEHPNLVGLGELFCCDGQWAFSMDLIQGVDLIDYVRAAPTQWAGACGSEENTASLGAVKAAPVVELPNGKRYSVRPGGHQKGGFVELPDGARYSLKPVSGDGESDASEESEAPDFDDDKLRHAFVQLARGLSALHAVDKIHRDIKPSNVLIRDDGHLFLLDFGLVVELTSGDRLTAHQNVLGTPAYMAPEHASGDNIGPASDWYSAGVVLFEALTGRLPFEGNALQVMLAKQHDSAPRPSSLARGVPRDLDDLCVRLLEFDPAERATAESVFRVLGEARPTLSRITARTAKSSETLPFVGRQHQLQLLDRTFAKTLSGGASAVILEGDSGTGKTCLARRFLERVQLEYPKAIVVSGRCYENEAVPYNAWDSAIESFSSYWRRLDPENAAALLPTHIGALTQTFPSLHLVPAVNRAAARNHQVLDPIEVRRRAFSALRDLFERVTQRGPTIVFIDDLQWIDLDSVSLLAEVLREPSAPALMFLATQRIDSMHAEVDAGLRHALQRTAVYCRVPRLDDVESTELAHRLVGDAGPESDAAARAIAKEAHGHALLITELARYVTATGLSVNEPLSLTAALWARIAEHSPPARALITVLSVAVGPLPSSVAARAAELPPGDLPRVVASLRVSHLVRTSRLSGVEWIEPYHDRIRTAVLPHEDENARCKVAAQIARALEGSPYADPHLLADYWRAAGDTELAGKYAREAGDAACSALAFERAATLYDSALKRTSLSAEERHQLLVLYGDTLASAGRGKEAADTYEHARQGATGVEVFELERKAGEQLLRAGHYDAGISVTKRGLKRLGVRWPESSFETIVTLIVLRLFLALRGRRFTPREESEIARRDIARIDVCNNIGTWLIMANSLRAMVFQLHHLRFALAAGEVCRISTSVSYEMARVGVFNGGRSKAGVARLRKQIESASALAKTTRVPYQDALVAASAGVSLVSAALPREGVERLEAAEWVFRERCWGKSWEIVSGQLWAMRGYYFLGEFAALVTTQSRALHETADRRELYGKINLRIGYANFAWLVRDDVESAAAALAEAIHDGNGRGFSLEQNYLAFATTNLMLYRGEEAQALLAVEQGWGALRKSGFRFISGGRYMSSEYRARAHLAFAMANPAERKTQLARAAPWIRDVARTESAYAVSMANLLEAEVATITGDHARAVQLLRGTIDVLVQRDLGGYVAVARRALGKLLGGDEGAGLVQRAEDFLGGQEVKHIRAFCRCLAPGFAGLE